VVKRIEQRQGRRFSLAGLYQAAAAAAYRQPTVLIDGIELTRHAVTLAAANQAVVTWRAARDGMAAMAGMTGPPPRRRLAPRQSRDARCSGSLRGQLHAVLCKPPRRLRWRSCWR
jgi:hypothetical protein